MRSEFVAGVTVVFGALLYAFKRLEPITESTALFPFFTYVVIGLALNGVVQLFWLQLYVDMKNKLYTRILWYSVMVSWPLATDQLSEVFTHIAISGIGKIS